MPKLSDVRLSNSALRSLTPGDEVADAAIKGLSARRSNAGTVTFSLRYQVGSGKKRKQRRMNLGRWPAMTADAARDQALALLARVAKGEDPSADERAKRREPDDPTVAFMVERWMATSPHIKETTRKYYQGVLKRYILPRFGDRIYKKVSRVDITETFSELSVTKTKNVANSFLQVMSTLYSWGVANGVLESSPCFKIKKHPPPARERFLSPEERSRLWGFLEDLKARGGKLGRGQRIPRGTCEAIQLLMLTGCRKSEIISLKWEYLDFERSLIHLPDTKIGRQSRPVSSMCVAFLEEMKTRRTLAPWVCLNSRGKQFSAGALYSPWERIRRHVELADVRIHDLRHSVASDGLAEGLSLAEIGKVLGHRSPATTARYAHLADDVARAAVERIGRRMDVAHQSRETFDDVVLEFPSKKRKKAK